MNYRYEARAHLKRSEKELETGEDERLKYAALELRMAMEALTYDRALSYKDEFPPSEYETWQPRKVMSVLLDIDPAADKDKSIAIGKEEEYGVIAPEMMSLGSEKILNMEILRRHYDALGSYLHAQSIKQRRIGKALDYGKIRSRCQEIVAFIKAVLSSPVFNVTLGNFAALDCMNCGKPIRKRIPNKKGSVHAECYECRASYIITDNGNGQVEWQPQQHEVECANCDCKQKIFIWQNEIDIGKFWTCTNCGGRNTFVLAIQYEAGR